MKLRTPKIDLVVQPTKRMNRKVKYSGVAALITTAIVTAYPMAAPLAPVLEPVVNDGVNWVSTLVQTSLVGGITAFTGYMAKERNNG